VLGCLVEAVRGRFGRIDVVAYGPISGEQGFTPAAELDASALEGLLPLLLLTPVEVVRAVLPEWTERGDGAFLLAQGYSAARPMPDLSGLGPVMAATRNYLHSLHAELADKGVYAGALTIASLIDRSEVSAAARAAFDAADGPRFPVADPDDLAEHYWDMYTVRDRAERFHPESLTPPTAA
jgi:NAD(P)-dependent dehydrogenase (short-subunit alcohol dehydrogenase family)